MPGTRRRSNAIRGERPDENPQNSEELQLKVVIERINRENALRSATAVAAAVAVASAARHVNLDSFAHSKERPVFETLTPPTTELLETLGFSSVEEWRRSLQSPSPSRPVTPFAGLSFLQWQDDDLTPRSYRRSSTPRPHSAPTFDSLTLPTFLSRSSPPFARPDSPIASSFARPLPNLPSRPGTPRPPSSEKLLPSGSPRQYTARTFAFSRPLSSVPSSSLPSHPGSQHSASATFPLHPGTPQLSSTHWSLSSSPPRFERSQLKSETQDSFSSPSPAAPLKRQPFIAGTFLSQVQYDTTPKETPEQGVGLRKIKSLTQNLNEFGVEKGSLEKRETSRPRSANSRPPIGTQSFHQDFQFEKAQNAHPQRIKLRSKSKPSLEFEKLRLQSVQQPKDTAAFNFEGGKTPAFDFNSFSPHRNIKLPFGVNIKRISNPTGEVNDALKMNYQNYGDGSSPGASPRQAPSPQGVNHANGINGGVGLPAMMAGLPTPAGHQSDLNYIQQMVDQLSQVLADNQNMTDRITTSADRVRVRAAQMNMTNDEIIKEVSEALNESSHHLEEENSRLRKELDEARFEEKANLDLCRQFQKQMAHMLEQAHAFKLKTTEDMCTWHRSYRNQLADERQANLQLNCQILDMQEHAALGMEALRKFRRAWEDNPFHNELQVQIVQYRQSARFWKRLALRELPDDDSEFSDDSDIIDPVEKKRLAQVEADNIMARKAAKKEEAATTGLAQ